MSNTQSSKFKTFGFIFALSIVALTLTLWAKGIIYASVLALLIFVILLITKRLWIPEGYGKYRVRMTSLSVMLTAALSFGFWQGFVESAVMLLIESLWPGMASRFTIRDVSPYALLGFLLLAVGLINYFNRDKTAMCDHPKPINEDIWPKIDKKILKGICNCLKDDLEEIDRKTNWSAQHFTPLDAEVIVDTGDTTKKRITDLLRAIKKSDDRVFLVLGEPGSGKSVALRKLARDLLKKAPETGKIPIYINLKEWWMDEQWSEANPPTSQQLYAFVQENLRSRDPISREFFDKKFAPLHAYGRLYYILDSFDEIPTVLDEGEDSELIHQLSEIIFKFLKGARTESSQGILASRISRQPKKEFKATTLLEIRPFTEEKIIRTLKRSGHNAEELLHRLFKEREELVPVARNPFSASLISEHAKHNQNSLPENQMEMYDGYIDRALEKCRHRIEKRKLSKEIIVKCAIEIADIMFQKYGLEAPINLIRDEISEYPVEDVVDVLILARLGRSGTGDENRFCFVHQRFTEYFAVQKIINKDRNIEMETIPTASQWRDAMVLYCEVVEESNAIKIAEFCWDIIKTINDPMNKRVLNCMRFLGDAYKCRLGCIQSFRTEFAEYIFKNIGENINMLLVKLAVETLGLFEEKDIDRSIVKVMDIGNPWLNETAFKSCRNLSKISKELEDKLMRYIEPISLTFSFRQRKELNFSLSLSAAFYKLKHFHKYLTYAMVFYITIAITSVTILSRQKFLENAWRIDKKDLELSIGIIWFIIYFILGCYKRIRFLGVQIKYNQILLILKQWTPSIVFLLVAIISAKLDLIWIPILILTSGTVFFASRIIYNIITNSRIIHFEKKRLKQLDIDMYCNRPAIQKAIQSFELDSTKLEFVKLLEVNVTEVSGNWLNSSILYARNNNEYIIRLAKLEEKWLGLNR